MERHSKKTTQGTAAREAKNIVFFHPDLGIGGAERLVVDAAVGLKERGDNVTIYTSHCDPKHCFEEVRDGTLNIRVRGNWLIPATIFGRLKILCSVLRQIHLLCTITLNGELAQLKPTAFFIDQLAAGIPFLRWFWEDTKIIFYCHFPDLLLVKGRQKWYKRVWRIGFDWLEGWGMRGADRVVVNSNFTKGKVESIWKGLGGERGLGVVYPCVDTTGLHQAKAITKGKQAGLWPGKKVLLSINRFEKKKGVGLAVRAFAQLSCRPKDGRRLVIAGGYDTREQENVDYLKELEKLAEFHQLKHATAKNVVSAQSVPDDIEVLFLLSVPDQLKASLLETAVLLIYTPSNEHFGIVPLEAMLAEVPVLASNSGGPLETVLDGETGWLRSIDHVDQWSDILTEVLYEMPEAELRSMGEHGRQHVQALFSKSKMASTLEEEIAAMLKASRQRATELGDLAVAFVLFMTAILSIGVVVNEASKVKGAYTLGEILTGSTVILFAVGIIMVIPWRLMQNESAMR